MKNLKLTLKTSSKFQILYLYISFSIRLQILFINIYHTDTIAPGGTVYHEIARNFPKVLGYTVYGGGDSFSGNRLSDFLSLSFNISKLFGINRTTFN